MPQKTNPFIEFDRLKWSQYRRDTPLTLTQSDIDNIKGYNDPVSLSEVSEIYLPLSRLLHMYVDAMQQLHRVTSSFLGSPDPIGPFVIGVSGSVAVGKSTTSRILQALLSNWPSHPKVTIVSTDNFLFPTQFLLSNNLMEKKGFPESYDLKSLLGFLEDVKSGKPNLKVPTYSHEIYDIVPNEFIHVDQPQILILEGLNVLQVGAIKEGKTVPRVYVSDYFDFSIHVDADLSLVKSWFISRFLGFRENARVNRNLFMHQFTSLPELEAVRRAEYFWHNINEINYKENIEPFKMRAKCILHKTHGHKISKILLRR